MLRRRFLSQSVVSSVFVCTLSAFALIFSCACTSIAAEPTPEDQITGALEAWRSGDTNTAREQFSAVIASGSKDPRPYFYRGLIAEQLGENGDADFQAGAALEASRSQSTLVNRALERAQGPVRLRIEKIRQAARIQLKADPQAAQMAVTYRDALEARTQGDLATAMTNLASIKEGSDPRYSYMYGVVLAESGDLEAAKTAFAEGLKKEKSPKDVVLVSQALNGVQGSVRQMIEELSIPNDDGSVLTRQSNQRLVARRARMTEDDLLAEANEAAAKKIAMAEEDANARKMAAAAEIAAERAAEEARASKPEPAAEMEASELPTPETALAANDPPAETPAVAESAEKEMPAEDADASSNPFLGGAAVAPPVASTPRATGELNTVAPVSGVDAGPIELAYLPEAAELVIYARPADLMKSGFMSPLTSSSGYAENNTRMKADIGFDLTEIDSVTVGVANLMATMIPLAMGGPQAAGDPSAIAGKIFGGENAVIVLRTVSDQDMTGFLTKQGATTKDVGGSTVHVMQSPDGKSPNMAVFIADPKTFVFASEQGIESAIGRASSATRSEFEFASRSSHVVLAFASPTLAGMSGSIPQLPPTVPPQVTQLVDALRGNISGVGISLSAGSDMNLDISLSQAEASSDAATGLSGTVEFGRQMGPLAVGQAPPQFQPFLQQMIGSLKSSDSGSTLTLSAVIPAGLVQAIAENPEMLGPIAAAQQAAQRTNQRNNLKQATLSMFNFHDTFGHFPAADGDGNGKTGLSWRVHLLPYMDQGELYEQFRLDEPWDSDHNKALISQMPLVYKVDGVEQPGMTTMHVFVGEKCAFQDGKGMSMRDITDGTSNTIMAVIAGPQTAVPWTQPGGLKLNEEDPISVMGFLNDSFPAAMMDGSVRDIARMIDPATLSLLIQPKDGQPVQF